MKSHVQVAASPILFAILPRNLLVGMAWSLESVIPKNTMQLENALENNCDIPKFLKQQ